MLVVGVVLDRHASPQGGPSESRDHVFLSQPSSPPLPVSLGFASFFHRTRYICFLSSFATELCQVGDRPARLLIE